MVKSELQTHARKKALSRGWKIFLSVLLVVIVAAAIAAEYAIRHVEPILRARIIQTLSTRFDSQVQLGSFHITLDQGLGVEGENLSLRSNLYPDLPPQISLAKFGFHTGLEELFHRPMHIGLVELQGLVINLPPKSERAAMPHAQQGHGKRQFIIDRIQCDNALLTLMTDDPKKTPLQFQIRSLVLDSVGSHRPMQFRATLVNPKPIGDIATHGHFGPWNAEEPHSTPVDGVYSFTHADLSTTHGISGMLSSTGQYSGPLDNITVDGTTDTPDFSVDVSGHPVALHTEFHAIVNGTNGNTYLQPVHARFLHTDVLAQGQVVRGENDKGHDINLDVVIDKGRIEDLLQLGASSDPVMTGSVLLKTKFDLPTGEQSVSKRLRLQGKFRIEDAKFTNPTIQKRVDELSLRGQGKAEEAKQLPEESETIAPPLPEIPAALIGTFSLVNQRITMPQLEFQVPGADIILAGKYSLDGNQFDFAGRARLQAHVSSFVGGWKGRLLTPLDPFFSKHGAGTDVPIKISGTKSHPHFGLNF